MRIAAGRGYGDYVRRLRRAKLAFFGTCPDCGHDWREHPGGGFNYEGLAGFDTGTCGECHYEVEHQQRATTAPPCRMSAPPRPDA